mmetsp:Transcript_7251/g.26672  ORF Transcript_7251/g.26672 Transcript_7251/m.26672 type:complete len:492 (+) Transcript_7251:187-1662(+)
MSSSATLSAALSAPQHLSGRHGMNRKISRNRHSSNGVKSVRLPVTASYLRSESLTGLRRGPAPLNVFGKRRTAGDGEKQVVDIQEEGVVVWSQALVPELMEEEEVEPIDPNALGEDGYPAYIPEGLQLAMPERSSQQYFDGYLDRILCMVPGGVGEQLWFFRVVRLLKRWHPQASIDIACAEEAQWSWDMNPDAQSVFTYDLEGLMEPAALSDNLIRLKGKQYDLVVSAKPTGLAHGWAMWLINPKQKVSYGPALNGASEDSPKDIVPLSVGEPYMLGKDMYDSLAEACPISLTVGDRTATLDNTPLWVGVLPEYKQWAVRTLYDVGVDLEEEPFVLVHGIPTDSEYPMGMMGDKGAFLSLSYLNRLAEVMEAALALKVVVCVSKLSDVSSDGSLYGVIEAKIPAKLGALVEQSILCVSANTIAPILASGLGKPAVALFSSEEKAKTFCPEGVGAVVGDEDALCEAALKAIIANIENTDEAPATESTPAAA